MAEHGEHGALDSRPPHIAWACLGAIGAVGQVLALLAVQPFQFNVITYTLEPSPGPRYWPAPVFALAILAAPIAVAAGATWAHGVHARVRRAMSSLWPLILSAPLAGYAVIDVGPPFICVLLFILGAGWAAYLAGTACRDKASPPTDDSESRRATGGGGWSHGIALGSILAVIAVLAVVHTRLQINLFEHMMLGHPDIGHFTEELKNTLAGRGLRSESFENTRLGWHFSPLLYVLVPGYALWPSPVYLMVCGSLLVHLTALPAYLLARRLSGCAGVGLMFAAAWLLLPSSSRLVYCNTYGFEWICAVIPLVGIMVTAVATDRRWTFWSVVVLIALCEETTTAATFGMGLHLALFTRRRAAGLIMALGSVAYLVLCTGVFIPHFAAAGHYERMDLFGELGGTFAGILSSAFTRPDLFFGRLVRVQGLHFLLILLVPMALLPLRNWRLSLAALPTVLLLLLLQNEQWLSVKFWHQATVLPMLFFAGIASLGVPQDMTLAAKGAANGPRGGRAMTLRMKSGGTAVAVLICAAWGHYFFGFSPISKSYEVYANDAFLQRPDPRMEIVQRLRGEIQTDRTVLATERLAAHFTDYRRIYTGRRMRPADLVIIDRADAWDTSELPKRAGDFAADPAYRLYGEFGSIVVFERRAGAPPVPAD